MINYKVLYTTDSGAFNLAKTANKFVQSVDFGKFMMFNYGKYLGKYRKNSNDSVFCFSCKKSSTPALALVQRI